jgi:hypothetical protein
MNMGFFIKGIDKFISVNPFVMNSKPCKTPEYNSEIDKYQELNNKE